MSKVEAPLTASPTFTYMFSGASTFDIFPFDIFTPHPLIQGRRIRRAHENHFDVLQRFINLKSRRKETFLQNIRITVQILPIFNTVSKFYPRE